MLFGTEEIKTVWDQKWACFTWKEKKTLDRETWGHCRCRGYLVSATLLLEEDPAWLVSLVSKTEHLKDKSTHASSTFFPEEPTSQPHWVTLNRIKRAGPCPWTSKANMPLLSAPFTPDKKASLILKCLQQRGCHIPRPAVFLGVDLSQLLSSFSVINLLVVSLIDDGFLYFLSHLYFGVQGGWVIISLVLLKTSRQMGVGY